MIQRFENSGALHRHDRIFKPAVLRHFRAAAHTVRCVRVFRAFFGETACISRMRLWIQSMFGTARAAYISP
jgi:hypothetical protein